MLLGTVSILGAPPEDGEHAPLVLDPSDANDAEWMSHLIGSGRVRSVHDTLERQIDALARLRAGARAPAAAVQAERERVLDGRSLGAFGRWVFYPWSGRLVRVLPPEELRELRLHRGLHRVTAEEQARLAGFTVGVAGLGLGAAAAVALALEGACGRLKLADAGELAAGDLNHVAAGVHELGLSLALLAARRACEADPYAAVSVHRDELEGEALQELFGGDAPLDAVVDACDDLELKLRLREEASARRVPVLAITSDRGTVDVERYDLEPERAPFHGRLGALRAEEWRGLGRDERVALALALVGPDEVSHLAAASLVEARGALGALPRLAGDAAAGAAAIAAAVRRLALGRPLPSGRRRLDVEAVLAGPEAAAEPLPQRPALRSLAGVDGRVPELVRFAVEAGTAAPSRGNCQPWRFKWDGERLWVQHDRARSASLLDVGHRASYVALGAVLENVAVAAAHRGHRVRTDVFPRPHDPTVVAAVGFEPGGPGLEGDAALYPQVEARATNRRPGRREPLGAEQATVLSDAARARGARLDLLLTEEELAEARAVIAEGERIRFLCRELHQEMMGRVRWTAEEAERTGDGISVETLHLAAAEVAAMRLAARADVAAYLRELGGGRPVREVAERALAGASGVGLATVGGISPASVLRGGRAVERVWLQATALGLSLHPMTGLVYMFELLDTSAGTIFTGRERAELQGLRERFDALFPGAAGGTRLLLFRVTRAGAPAARAPRRPVEEVLAYGRPAMAA